MAGVAASALVIAGCTLLGAFGQALVDRPTELVRSLNAEIVLTGANEPPYLTGLNRIPQDALNRALATPGVKSTTELHIERVKASWRSSPGAPAKPITVLGLDPAHPAILLPEADINLAMLNERGSVVLNSNNANFGSIHVGQTASLSGHEVKVVGTVSLGDDYADQDTILTSPATFQELFGTDASTPSVDLGLIQTDPDVAVETVVARLRAALPNTIAVNTKDSIVAQERTYAIRQSPLVATFQWAFIPCGLMLLVINTGYLFSKMPGYLPEFGMLSTIGYSVPYLMRVVFCELLWITGLGGLVALVIVGLVRMVIQIRTAVPLEFGFATWSLSVLLGTAASLLMVVCGRRQFEDLVGGFFL